jgi:DNA-binding HxlR family transcriptional regulator
VLSNVLDVFGDKWTLLVVRDLFFFNKHEYKEFLNSPEAIATNILSDRLKRLAAWGIIDETIHPDNKSRKLYYLTPKGKELLPVLFEMARWGSKYFPDLKSMQAYYRRIEQDENKLKKVILDTIQKWEKRNLTSD